MHTHRERDLGHLPKGKCQLYSVFTRLNTSFSEEQTPSQPGVRKQHYQLGAPEKFLCRQGVLARVWRQTVRIVRHRENPSLQVENYHIKDKTDLKPNPLGEGERSTGSSRKLDWQARKVLVSCVCASWSREDRAL